MSSSIQTIPLANLAVIFIPALAVVWISYKWSTGFKNSLYAIFRMMLQLLTIGYCLEYLFQSENIWIILLILVVMNCSAAWIALRTVQSNRRALYARALLSIALGGGAALLLVILIVLDVRPWYLPRYLIPLAGMTFSSSLNSVSLAAERFKAELNRGESYVQARETAFRSSLVPILNFFFAVGIVTLPGMMTGQILSGISPLIAVRYQAMVMCMTFGASGLSSALFLKLLELRTHELMETELS